jgi:predicted transcriptional regulator of viral defense system
VEVLDTLNNEKIVYLSIREASQAIEVGRNVIPRALKYLNEKGVSPGGGSAAPR